MHTKEGQNVPNAQELSIVLSVRRVVHGKPKHTKDTASSMQKLTRGEELAQRLELLHNVRCEEQQRICSA